ILLVDEIRDGFLNCRIVRLSASEQSYQAPSCLRGGRISLPFRGRIGVAPQGLAEAAVRFLDGTQPIDRALAKFFCGERNGFESAQRAAGAINVIYAPASKPGTVFALIS